MKTKGHLSIVETKKNDLALRASCWLYKTNSMLKVRSKDKRKFEESSLIVLILNLDANVYAKSQKSMHNHIFTFSSSHNFFDLENYKLLAR
jgi:hypothetical protein